MSPTPVSNQPSPGPEVSRTLLRTNLELGRFEAVETDLAKLPEGSINDPEILSIRARLLQMTGRSAELRELCDRFLDAAVQPPALRAVAHLHWANSRIHDTGEYRVVAERLTPFLNEIDGSQVGHATYSRLLCNLGMAWFRLREFGDARRYFHDALAIAERAATREVVSEVLGYLGLVEQSTLDWTKADALLLEASRIQSEEGSGRKELTTLVNLANLRLIRGQFTLCLNAAQRAARLAEELSEHRRAGLAQILLSWASLRLGRYKTAGRQLLRVRKGASVRGELRTFALTHEYLGELALRERRLGAARRWLKRAYRLIESVPDRDIMGEVQCRLAEVELQSGNTELALDLVITARAAFEKMNDCYEINVCKRVHGQVLLTLDRRAEAIEVLDEALAFFRQVDERFESYRVERLLDAAHSGGKAEDVDLINLPLDDEGIPDYVEEQEAVPEGMAADVTAPNVNTRKRTSNPVHPDFPGLLGVSFEFKKLLSRARHAARLDVHLLIVGETGTGKEYLTQAIHKLGRRGEGPLVPYNCGCGSPELMDAEFFGHKRGSFTGANVTRDGLVRTAHNGTLFLDEIAELNPQLQSRLLRMIESGEIRPVGSDTSEFVDVRIISATHQDLARKVDAGTFRRDLYHRLAGIEILVPPLRNRLDDLEVLVENFSALARQRGCSRFAGVSDDVLAAMRLYRWPGNIRELRNVIFDLAMRTPPGRTALHWAPPGADTRQMAKRSNIAIEREVIEDELRRSGGNVTAVTDRLRISRQKFYRLCEQWGVDIKAFR